MYTRNITTTRINNTIRNYNGGYIVYFKLMLQLGSLFKQLHELEKYLGMPTWKRFLYNGVVGFKFSLQLIFKPLLWVFHTKIVYEGTYELETGYKPLNIDVDKTTTIYFLRFLPILKYWTSNLKDKDWDKLLK